MRSRPLLLGLVFVLAAAVALGGVLLFSGSTEAKPPRDAYPSLRSGDCFVRVAGGETRRRPCAAPHDGRVVATAPLRGTLRTTSELAAQARELCESRARAHLESTPQDGRTYRPYTIHPDLAAYLSGAHRTAACALLEERGGRG